MKNIQKIAISFLGAAAFAGASFAGLGAANAAEQGADLEVSATISNVCVIRTTALPSPVTSA